MQITEEHIENWKKALGFKSKATQETYFYIINKFTREYDCSISKEDALAFLSSRSKNSILTTYYALKHFYRAGNMDLDISMKDISPTGIKVIRPVMSREEVFKIIDNCKISNKIGDIEKGYFCMATVYGFRRKELYDMKYSDIDVENGIIYSSNFTAKSKDAQRDNVIPENIIGIIAKFKKSIYKARKKFKVTKLNLLFDYVCTISDVKLRPRLGWHSLRRSLVTELMMSDIQPLYVRDFIRWKPKERDIIFQYTILDWRKVDHEIFKRHPFLERWSLEETPSDNIEINESELN